MKGLLIAATLMTLSLSAFAQSNAPKDSDKLDLKKLEDKYWAAKDTDFSVVQNRLYTKDSRFFVNLGYGTLVNDAYSTGKITNAEAGYYFSERWGFSVGHAMFDMTENESTGAYIAQYGVFPDYNQSKAYTSVSAIWVPFYAKMSFLDRKIMYFDMQVSAGVGQKKYTIKREAGDEDKTTMGYHLNFSQHLFFHKYMALRLDLKNEWSNQERARYKTNTVNGPLSNNTINDTTLLLGLTVFFGSGGAEK